MTRHKTRTVIQHPRTMFRPLGLSTLQRVSCLQHRVFENVTQSTFIFCFIPQLDCRYPLSFPTQSSTVTMNNNNPQEPDLDYLLSVPPALPTPPPTNPKKRPLEDKKARDRKRVLRNRELARVSNERRKGRIKAMENELNETRQTVSTLEESIRCLEAENNELRNLLQGKETTASTAAPPRNQTATNMQQPRAPQ